jgi:hypothetical protein
MRSDISEYGETPVAAVSSLDLEPPGFESVRWMTRLA